MFSLEIKYEFEDFLRWQKLYNKLYGKVKRIIFYALGFPYALFMAMLAVWNIHYFGYADFLDVLLLLLSAALAAVLLLRDRINAKRARKMYINKDDCQYCVVDEDGISYTAANNEGRHLYGGIIALYADDSRAFAIIDKLHAVILPFRCLTVGTAAELCSYLSEKTGLEVKRIK